VALPVLAVALAGPGSARSTPGPATLAHFPDGPPARVTGGFGEDTCGACHFDFGYAPAQGRAEVAGFPGCYSPGAAYDLEVVLEDPGMAVAGFQLAVRFEADGTQAGILAAAPEHATAVAVVVDRDVAFAQHTLDGSALPAPGAAHWRIRWTAPPGADRVLLHAAMVAGDGDRSQDGDVVYTVERMADGGCDVSGQPVPLVREVPIGEEVHRGKGGSEPAEGRSLLVPPVPGHGRDVQVGHPPELHRLLHMEVSAKAETDVGVSRDQVDDAPAVPVGQDLLDDPALPVVGAPAEPLRRGE
jgi:hypothetical protein